MIEETRTIHHGMGETKLTENETEVVQNIAMYVGTFGIRFFNIVPAEQRARLNKFLDQSDIQRIKNNSHRKGYDLFDKTFWPNYVKAYKVTQEKVKYLIEYINNSPNYEVVANSECIDSTGARKIIHYATREVKLTSSKRTEHEKITDSVKATKNVNLISQSAWNILNDYRVPNNTNAQSSCIVH